MRRLLLGLALMLLAPAPAHAWGAPGHHLIVELAYARLDPSARAVFDRLVAAGPAHPIEACPLSTRAQIATWPDCARFQDPFKATYNEHFDDIPLFGRATRRSWCHDDACATRAIARNRKILADRSTSDGARLEALSFLVHYVGDIHQPLHAADNNDKGGNYVKVIFLGAETYPGRDGAPTRFNLHGVWDTPLVGAALADDGRAAIAMQVDAQLRARIDTNPDHWARDAHALAVRVAYGALPIVMSPGAAPSAPVSVDQAYVDTATPVVRAQLARATARLVATLNATLR